MRRKEFSEDATADEMFYYIKEKSGKTVVRAEREYGSVEYMVYRNGQWYSIVRNRAFDDEGFDEIDEFETTDKGPSSRSAAYGFFRDIERGRYSAVMIPSSEMTDLELLAEKYEDEHVDFNRQNGDTGE